MIQRFTIKNFKRFQDETVLELDPVTVLIGANNSGKSTILQAFNLFQYCIETTRRRNADSAPNGGLGLVNKTVSPDEFGALPVADSLDLWPQGRAKRPITLVAEYEPGTQVGFDLTISYNRFSIRPTLKGDWEENLRRGVIRFVPIFSGFLPREEFLTLPARIDRMRLQRHGEIVRNLLWDLRENAPDRWRRLLEILRRLFPESAVEVDSTSKSTGSSARSITTTCSRRTATSSLQAQASIRHSRFWRQSCRPARASFSWTSRMLISTPGFRANSWMSFPIWPGKRVSSLWSPPTHRIS